LLCEQINAVKPVDHPRRQMDNLEMNDSTEGDWYSIRYQDDDGLVKGRKIEVISPQMQKDNVLGFLAIQVKKKKQILGIRKNDVELDLKTIVEFIQRAKKIPC
jgi:hypothetical protein